MRPASRTKALLAAAIALVATAGVAAAAIEPVGADFRISNVGGDTDADRDADHPAVAYNSAANEYLVAWAGDSLATDGEFEIFGQRVSAAGAELGADFRISNLGMDGDADRDAEQPAVAYDSAVNEYLVVWEGDGLATEGELEIFGQRLSAAGAQLGADFRISNLGMDGDAARDAEEPAVAYNSNDNQYLVTWHGDGLVDNGETEIFGQRLSGGGAELSIDFRISNVGTDGDTARDAESSALAYTSTGGEYVVVWEGDGLATDGEVEIFGQRVSAAGAQVPNATDFRISNLGTDGNDDSAENPALAFAPTVNEYLVTWQGSGPATNFDPEIFGQRLGGGAAELGSDFQIFNTAEAADPAVAYSSAANEYMVTFEGAGPTANNQFEILGQRLSAAGAKLGTDVRISHTTDVGANREPFESAVAYNAAANEYLATWAGDGLPTDSEYEIFGRRLAEPASAPNPAGKCGGKQATKVGTSGRDVIKGTKKRDVIAALGGNDVVRSLGGNDRICGGKGKDTMNGGKGKDLLLGEAGKDTLKGGKGRDTLKGGKGRDTLLGGSDRDKLNGGPGKDTQSQ